MDEIAQRGRGTPRVALRLLRRVRDYAQVRGDGSIDGPSARQSLDLLEIDELLDAMDLDEEDLLPDDVPQQLRFDLCTDCYRKYMQDPLGTESALRVGFSSN